ncbi:MAG: TonB-dependent receptor, partial [Bryobacterales bacterium]|nr:TonB-dependent receptor [Bryobacterales bacterium]
MILPSVLKAARSRLRNIVLATGLLCLFQFSWAQQAQVSGTVRDPSDAAIVGASVELVNVATQERWDLLTNGQGRYVAPSLPSGEFRITARAKSFETRVLEGVRVEVAAKLTIDLTMQIGTEAQSVTVEAGQVQLNTVDASLSTVVDRGFVSNIPLNGRSFQSLLTLIPGVNAIPSGGSGTNGQFSVNGMRAESNYFLVDGVSANTGVNTASPGRGAGYSGSLPAGTALGTTQSLASMDAVEEFRGVTSTYSAEYGRVPGGQFSFTTRSGTNEIHGSLYEYFRNDALDANSFFDNRNGVSQPKMRQNNFGGTVGAPVWAPGLYNGKDRTFFFFSYEALRLRSPQESRITSVPTAALRNEIAPPELRQVLSAFPLPSPGYAEESGHTAPFVASYSQPSSIDSSSLRLDHAFTDAFRVFGRYAYVPSSTSSR